MPEGEDRRFICWLKEAVARATSWTFDPLFFLRDRHEWRRVKPVLLALLREALDTFPEAPPPEQPQAQPTAENAPGDAAQQQAPSGLVLQQHAPQIPPPVDVEWYLSALDGFAAGPPFTIQRLCEVLLSPRQHYSRKHKLAHSLEKLLMVTSTIPAGPAAAVIADRVAASRAAAAAVAATAAAAAAATAAANAAATAAATAAQEAGDAAMAPQAAADAPHGAPGGFVAAAVTGAGSGDGLPPAAAMEVDGGGQGGGEAAASADAAQPSGRSKAPCSPGAVHGVVGGMHASGAGVQAVHVGAAARC